MSYKAFALKYRPRNFEEVIGQPHVVSALKKAILNDRVHHAYLFSGPRGIGKTSLARILARSLNCFEGPTLTPCGKCTSCTEIERGASFDVIEIDGASNRGIDDIRTLRENVKLSPAYSRYKIYIIDEVHQITSDGFNALLKTLEEPPAHVKFIFATTHPQKILPTILSRCQKFQFHLLATEQIVEKLKRITDQENINIEKKILYSIARASSGSIRDAESLLDQFVPIILDKKDPGEVTSFLGVIDEETLNTMAEYIVEKDLIKALGFLNTLVEEGKDLGSFLLAFIEHLRNIMLVKLSPAAFTDLIYVSPQTKDFLKTLAAKISVSQVLSLIDLILEAKEWGRKLDSLRIPFEVVLIKFCGSYQASPPEKGDAVSQKPPPKTSSQKSSRPKLEPSPEAKKQPIDFSPPEDITEKNPEEAGNNQPSLRKKTKSEDPSSSLTDQGEVTMDEIKAAWGRIISELKKERVSLGSYLSEATLVSCKKNILTLGFPKKCSFHKEIVEKSKNNSFIEEFIGTSLGKSLSVKYTLIKDAQISDDGSLDHLKKYQPPPGNEEFVNDLLDTFEGTFDV